MNLQNSLKENRLDLFLNKLTNFIMIDGKKTKASIIVLNTLVVLKKKIRKDLAEKNQSVLSISHNSFQKNFINSIVLRVILRAIENLTPNLEVRKVRVSGSTYLVPAIIAKKKQETLALKWLIEAATKRQKNGRLNFSTCLAEEILDAYQKQGHARQKRDELHRLAQLNRAFVRYRWW